MVKNLRDLMIRRKGKRMTSRSLSRMSLKKMTNPKRKKVSLRPRMLTQMAALRSEGRFPKPNR